MRDLTTQRTARRGRWSRLLPRLAVWACGSLWAGGSLCACGDGHGLMAGHERVHGSSNVGGQVVSTVDGDAITVADVRALIGDGALAPHDALRRLQDERVLAHEAARRGIAEDWEVAAVARKASVQALLADAANNAVVTDGQLEAAYTTQIARFETAEQRGSVHLLAKVKAGADAATDAAARAAVERLIPLLASAEDLDGFVQTYASVAVAGVPIICEKLPLLPLKGRLVEAYANAMFALKAPGMVPGVVRTSYGWHVIRVTEIVPASRKTKEEAFAVLRKELTAEARKHAVDELLAKLARAYPVQLSEDAAKSMAKLSLDGTAPALRGGSAF